MKQYKTIDIARRIGIHVNTVRLYEKCSLIPKPDRSPNGYRVFTDLHIEQFKLARAALRVEVLQNGLRKQAVNIIKVSAAGNYEEAAALTRRYIQQVDQERKNAEEAIQITRKILAGLDGKEHTGIYFTRKEAADFLGVTIDTLRNWELNGLFTIKRRENGYRVYSEKDIQRLKIIRSPRWQPFYGCCGQSTTIPPQISVQSLIRRMRMTILLKRATSCLPLWLRPGKMRFMWPDKLKKYRK